MTPTSPIKPTTKAKTPSDLKTKVSGHRVAALSDGLIPVEIVTRSNLNINSKPVIHIAAKSIDPNCAVGAPHTFLNPATSRKSP